MIEIMMKYNSIKEIVTGAPNDTQHKNNAHPKTSPIDCDGVLLTNVQCHMVPISISWYREYWTIQLIFTLQSRQETLTVLNLPLHQHGHTNFWYLCLLEKVYFNYYIGSYSVWYVYNKWSIWARTKVVRRKHIIQPTGFGTYSSTCFYGMETMCQRHGSN